MPLLKQGKRVPVDSHSKLYLMRNGMFMLHSEFNAPKVGTVVNEQHKPTVHSEFSDEICRVKLPFSTGCIGSNFPFYLAFNPFRHRGHCPPRRIPSLIASFSRRRFPPPQATTIRRIFCVFGGQQGFAAW